MKWWILILSLFAIIGVAYYSDIASVNAQYQIPSPNELRAQLYQSKNIPNTKYQHQFQLGVNLAGVNDYSSAWPFVDLMKSARPWIPQLSGTSNPWDTKQQIETDAQGWPILKPQQAAATLLMTNGHGVYPEGLYTCTFEGDGELHFGMDATIVDQSPGRVVLDVTPRDGIYMRIDRSDPLNPIRNIKVIMPDTNPETQLFHPEFINSLNGFSVLRFMDWGAINNSPVINWSQRTTPEHAMQSTATGVAIENMIDLCNQTNADPWFCIPAMADDNYIIEFAKLVNARLAAGKKIYLEYSNEIWNPQFKQSKYAQHMGTVYGLNTDKNIAKIEYQVKRSIEIFQLFQQYINPDHQLVRVLGVQTANTWATEHRLQFLNASQYFDVIAVGAYFGHNIGKQLLHADNSGEPLRAEQIIQLLDEDLNQLSKLLSEQKNIAEKYKLEMVAYEGGQHMVMPHHVPSGHHTHRLLAQVNRHPAMYNLYTKMIQQWRTTGGSAFLAFNHIQKFNRHGSWGLQESHFQHINRSPKLKALIDSNFSPEPLANN